MILAQGIQFDWTISFGMVINVLVFIFTAFGLYHAGMSRFRHHEDSIHRLTNNIGEHNDRMDRYDERMLEIVGDLQRIIGRVEMMAERRKLPRT